VDALLNLEGTDRFGGVGGFVNVSRHRDNLLVNGLGAFLFRNVCARPHFPSHFQLNPAESVSPENNRQDEQDDCDRHRLYLINLSRFVD
jgi:hypothetical protein